MKAAFLILIVWMIAIPPQVFAQVLRPRLVNSSHELLDEKLSPESFLRVAREEKQQRAFTLEEKNYLEDLTKKLPSALRNELCPTSEQGLCEGGFSTAQDWDQVPALPSEAVPTTAAAPSGSWFSRNSTWILVAAVGALAVGAWSLRNKEIQVGSMR